MAHRDDQATFVYMAETPQQNSGSPTRPQSVSSNLTARHIASSISSARSNSPPITAQLKSANLIADTPPRPIHRETEPRSNASTNASSIFSASRSRPDKVQPQSRPNTKANQTVPRIPVPGTIPSAQRLFSALDRRNESPGGPDMTPILEDLMHRILDFLAKPGAALESSPAGYTRALRTRTESPTEVIYEMPLKHAERQKQFAHLDQSHFLKPPTNSPVHIVRREKIGREWEDWFASNDEEKERVLYVALCKSNIPYATKAVYKRFLAEVRELMDTEEPFPTEQNSLTELMVELSNIGEFAKKTFMATGPLVFETGTFAYKTLRQRAVELRECLEKSELEERAKAAFYSVIREAAERFGAPKSKELVGPPHAPDSFLVQELEKLPSFCQSIFRSVLNEARDFLDGSRSTSLYVRLATQNGPGSEDEDEEDQKQEQEHYEEHEEERIRDRVIRGSRLPIPTPVAARQGAVEIKT